MVSRRTARWLWTLAAATCGLAACRDLVQPVPPEVDRGPEPFVQLLLEGLESNLDRATVTLDNSAYVPADRAGQWAAEAYLNEVRVDGAMPGIYDVNVKPVYRYSTTPEWTQTGVALGEEPVLVAYPVIEFAVQLDWPEFSLLGADSARTQIHFHYLLIDDDEQIAYARHQTARHVAGGWFAAAVPWERSYPVHVILEGDSMRMSFSYPEEVSVSFGSSVVLDSPLQERAVNLVAAGAPYAGNAVQLTHSEAPTEGASWPGYYDLRYVVDRTRQPDSVLLLPPFASRVEFTWREGPLFVQKGVFLTGQDLGPGTVNLGDHALVLRVTDSTAAGITGARITLGDSGEAVTDANGEVRALLDAGSYELSIECSGYRPRLTVLYVTGDQEATFVLESE